MAIIIRSPEFYKGFHLETEDRRRNNSELAKLGKSLGKGLDQAKI